MHGIDLYFIKSVKDGTPARREEIKKQSETQQLVEIKYDTTTYLYELPKWLKDSTKAKTEIKAMVKISFEELCYENKIVISDYDVADAVAYIVSFERYKD